MARAKRKSGLDPLSYLGVEPLSPPQLVVESRPPTINDSQGFNLGTLWLSIPDRSSPNNEVYALISLVGLTATWVLLYPNSGSGITAMATDSGTANAVGNQIDIFGEYPIQTSASGNAITVALDNGTDGQLLVGGGSNAAWSDLTSTGGTIAITTGPNTLNIDTVGGASVNKIQTDASSASPSAAGVINDFGANVIATSAIGNTVTTELLNGADGQVLIGGGTDPQWANLTSTGGTINITNGPNSINLEDASTGLDFITDSGTAQPSGGAITIAGGTNVTTSGSGSIVTVNSTGGGGGGATVAFFAYQASDHSTTAATYDLGSQVALTELFDQGTAFFPGDGAGSAATFTAPVTGIYKFTMQTRVNTAVRPRIFVITTQLPNGVGAPDEQVDGTNNNPRSLTTVSVEMNAGETAQFRIDFGSSGPTRIITGGTTSNPLVHTYVHGELVGTAAQTVSGSGFYAYLPQQVAYPTSAAPYDYLGAVGSALTEIFDTDGVFYPGDGAGNEAVYTAPITGVYFFNFLFAVGGNIVDNVGVYTTQLPNGVGIQRYSTSTGAATSYTISALVQMNAGEEARFGWAASQASTRIVDGALASNATKPGTQLTYVQGYRIY